MCWRRRRSPTAPCCAAAAARRPASPSPGRRSPTSGSTNRHFRQARVFSKGPFRRFGPVFDIEPEGGGSKVSYALEWEPLTFVGRLFGKRLAEQAGAAVEKRVLQAVAFVSGERQTMFDLPAPELPDGRARAGGGARHGDRQQPLRQWPRQTARRPCAGRHGERSRAHQAQAAGARVRRRTATRHRSLPRRRERGPAVHEMGSAVHQLPRTQAQRRCALRAAARRALPVVQHRLRSRLRAQRRARLHAGAGDPAADGRRLLPQRADGDAARAGPAPAGAGRAAHDRPRAAAGSLSPAHPASRHCRRHRA